MKILHLVIDDKFIDAAIREFESVAPGTSEYLMLGAKAPFRYVKDERVRSVDAAGLAREIARDDVRGVVFHALPPPHYGVLRDVPAGRKTVWIGWGYDYYGLLNDAFPDGLLMPATAALVGRMATPAPNAAARTPVPAVLSFARPYRKPGAAEVEALRRLDYFSPVVDTEYHLARRHQPWFQAQYLRWNYGTVEDDFTTAGLSGRTPGRNLLVGNSATATNNHLELFDLIRQRIDLTDRKIVVPLSYGDPNYRRHILQAGTAAFGDAFVPLVDYMPRDAYIETLGSCGFALMNHVRQQALGNVYISALLGAKVFLNTRNPMSGWLRAQGLPIADIEQCDTVALSAAERDAQITALHVGMGRQAQRERTRRLVEVLLS